jgi:hypothetical protein
MRTDSRNALVLIPCSKSKSPAGSNGQFAEPISAVKPLRDDLLNSLKLTPYIAQRFENRRGIFNDASQPTKSINLYSGQFYTTTAQILSNIEKGRYPSVFVLIVSALYGLVGLSEGIKEYDLSMGDELKNGQNVYVFWQEHQLNKALFRFIQDNNIGHVWSLLPSSLPHFPYQQVFEELWGVLRTEGISSLHVNCPGAGLDTGYRRALWFKTIVSRNESHLTGDPMNLDEIEAAIGGKVTYRVCS